MGFKKSLVCLALLVGSFSCATGRHRGVIAMKLSDTKAHVGIGSPEVAVGDHVELYRNQCHQIGPAREDGGLMCAKKDIGHGIVSKVFSPDYSEISFDSGVKFHEGDTVEKYVR